MNAEQVSALFTRLGSMEGKQDLILSAVQSHEKRIRSLEKYKVKVVTTFAIAAGAFAFVWDWVKDKVHLS